jgi:amino acid permease
MNRNSPFLAGLRNAVRRGSRGFMVTRERINSNEKHGTTINLTATEIVVTPNDGCESTSQSHGQAEHRGLRRDMTSNQLAMIAFSGSVGTGLIIGSGANLVNGELSRISLHY